MNRKQAFNDILWYEIHSSEISGLCSMKCSSKNLWYDKPHIVIWCNFTFLTRTFCWAHISYFWRVRQKSSYIPGKSLSFAQKFSSTKNNTKPTFIIHHHCWHFLRCIYLTITFYIYIKSLLCFYFMDFKKKLSNDSWPVLHYYW